MNRSAFFASVRASLGALSQSQVDGFNVILDEAERRLTTLFFLAYMLATAWWETGKTMQPVKEAFYIGAGAEAWRKKHLRYWPWYGRGLVQETWETNYRKADKELGLGGTLIANPDRALEPAIAVQIMFVGMEKGWFTSKGLDDYIDNIDESDAEDLREFTNARRIINGTDKAGTIGKVALSFEKALKAGGYGKTAIVAAPALPPPAVTAGVAGSIVAVAAPAAVVSADPSLWPWAIGGLVLLVVVVIAIVAIVKRSRK